MHRAARNDAGGLHFGQAAFGRAEVAFAVDGVTQTVHNAAEQSLADRNVDDRARTFNGVAFLNRRVIAEDHDTDVVGFEVQGHAFDAARELDHFAGLDVIEAVHTGDTVTDGEHLADFGGLSLSAEVGDLLLEDCGNFCGADFHDVIRPLS